MSIVIHPIQCGLNNLILTLLNDFFFKSPASFQLMPFSFVGLECRPNNKDRFQNAFLFLHATIDWFRKISNVDFFGRMQTSRENQAQKNVGQGRNVYHKSVSLFCNFFRDHNKCTIDKRCMIKKLTIADFRDRLRKTFFLHLFSVVLFEYKMCLRVCVKIHVLRAWFIVEWIEVSLEPNSWPSTK